MTYRYFGKSRVSDPDYKRAQEEMNVRAKASMDNIGKMKFEMRRPDSVIELAQFEPSQYRELIDEINLKCGARNRAIRRSKWRSIRARRFK